MRVTLQLIVPNLYEPVTSFKRGHWWYQRVINAAAADNVFDRESCL